VQLAEHDRVGSAQPFDGGGVVIGHEVVEGAGGSRCAETGGVEHVLQADCDTEQSPAAPGVPLGELTRGVERPVAVYGHPRSHVRIDQRASF
jgi:hypothetical protein